MQKILIAALFVSVAFAHPTEYGEWEEVERTQKAVVPQSPSIFSRLTSFWTWDRNAVREGVFKNENIMTHVAQNMFNFIMTTIAWFTVSQIYSATGALEPAAGVEVPGGRQWRALTITEAADEVLEAIRVFEQKRR